MEHMFFGENSAYFEKWKLPHDMNLVYRASYEELSRKYSYAKKEFPYHDSGVNYTVTHVLVGTAGTSFKWAANNILINLCKH